MNLATWLERAARASPEAVALFKGTSPWARYRELARRVACLAAGLRTRAGLKAGRPGGDRDDEFPGIPRGSLRAVVGGARRGAGEREASPEGGRLHRRGFRGAARHRSGPPARRAQGGRARATRRGGSCRARVAFLHQRHHRAAQGGDALASQPGADDLRLFRRRGQRRARRAAAARGAAFPRLGPLQLHAPRDGSRAGRSRIRELRSRGNPGAPRLPPRRFLLCRADHGEASRRSGARLSLSRRPAHPRLRRRPHVPRRPARGDGGARQRASRRSTARAKAR